MNIIDALIEVLKDSSPNAALTKADIARAKALLAAPAPAAAPAAPAPEAPAAPAAPQA